MEEAELLLKDDKASRGGEKAQNSVRFRNRPVAKAPEPGTSAPSQDAGLAQGVSTKQKEQLPKGVGSEDQTPTGVSRGYRSNSQSGPSQVSQFLSASKLA